MDAENRASSPRALAYALLWSPFVKAVLGRLPVTRRLYAGWSRIHPFDATHGVDTSGFVPAGECVTDASMAAAISPYGGSQPSIVRRSLDLLPDLHHYTFMDIGCGKGRPLLVASELPFRGLLGVEISPQLAAVARANAAVLARRFPDRPVINVEIGDATISAVPGPRAVCFIYHAFNASLLAALLRNLEAQLQSGLQHVFLVYYNPVHGEVIDRSAHFTRWSASTLPYAADELGYGPDLRDTVVIWQSLPVCYPAKSGAGAPILVDGRGWNARLGPVT